MCLCNDVVCDRKEGDTNLVTPDATRRVRSTFPAACFASFSPSPSPVFFLLHPTIHPGSAAPIYRPPFVSSMTRRRGEERFRSTKVRGSKPLICSLAAIFFPTMNSRFSYTIFFFLLFASFKILYRFGGDYSRKGKGKDLFPGFLLLSHVGFRCFFDCGLFTWKVKIKGEIQRYKIIGKGIRGYITKLVDINLTIRRSLKIYLI